MNTRCKFRVESIAPTEPADDTMHIVMRAVTSGSEENAEFFRYTPAGELKLWTVKKAAAAQLEVGKEYFIDISPA